MRVRGCQIKLSDSFKIAVGGAIPKDEKNIFTNYGQIAALVQLPTPLTLARNALARSAPFPRPGVTLPIYAPANNCTGNASFGKFTWRANAEYKLAPGKMVYASYSTGFVRAGSSARRPFFFCHLARPL